MRPGHSNTTSGSKKGAVERRIRAPERQVGKKNPTLGERQWGKKKKDRRMEKRQTLAGSWQGGKRRVGRNRKGEHMSQGGDSAIKRPAEAARRDQQPSTSCQRQTGRSVQRKTQTSHALSKNRSRKGSKTTQGLYSKKGRQVKMGDRAK